MKQFPGHDYMLKCNKLHLQIIINFPAPSLTGKENKQERPLGQLKTSPANKLPYMTSRLTSNTTGVYMNNIPFFYHSISE